MEHKPPEPSEDLAHKKKMKNPAKKGNKSSLLAVLAQEGWVT